MTRHELRRAEGHRCPAGNLPLEPLNFNDIHSELEFVLGICRPRHPTSRHGPPLV